MITDAETTFTDVLDFSVTALVSTTATPSTNIYDSRGGKATPANVNSNFGAGQRIYGFAHALTSITGTSSTLDLSLVSSAAAALTTPTVHDSVLLIAEADMVAGTTWEFSLPATDTYLRYIGFLLEANTANITAGTLTLMLTPSIDVLKAYASGLTFA